MHKWEILLPKKEGANILNISHETHLGQEMMVIMLRGKTSTSWCSSATPAKDTTDLMPRTKWRTVISLYSTSGLGTPSIWTFLVTTVKIFYLLWTDLPVTYNASKLPTSPPQQPFLQLIYWSNRYGYPYKIISDTGGWFRAEFIKQLEKLGVKTSEQCLSS